MSVQIRKIKPEETWPLRHKVMWPDQSYDFVKLPEDNDGLHYGLFEEERLVTIVSLYHKGKDYQFRKLATDFDVQGRGYGTQLLRKVFEEVEALGAERLWCNARQEKNTFYHRFGMVETDETFVKEGIDYVIMEKLF